MHASGERPSILPPARITVFVIEDDAPLRPGTLLLNYD